MAEPVEAWAVKGPDESLLLHLGLFYSEAEAQVGTISAYKGWQHWNSFHDRGYRCVPVTITEKEVNHG